MHDNVVVGTANFGDQLEIANVASIGEFDDYALNYRVEGTYTQTYAIDFNVTFQSAAGEVGLGFGDVEVEGGIDIDQLLRDFDLIQSNNLGTLFSLDLGSVERAVSFEAAGDVVSLETISEDDLPETALPPTTTGIDVDAPGFDPEANGGDDVLTSGVGSDLLLGGVGADTLIGDLQGGADTLDGGEGVDTGFLFGSTAGNFVQFVDAGGVSRNVFSQADVVFTFLAHAEAGGDWSYRSGSSGAQIIDVEHVNIDAGAGTDFLFDVGGTQYRGGSGTDTFSVDWSDTSNALAVNLLDSTATHEVNGIAFTEIERFVARFGSGDDHVQASGHLDGGLGDDTLLGSASNDTLIGGADNDRLNGAGGSDRYFFEGEFGSDVLRDSSAGNRIDFTTSGGVSLSQDAGDLRIDAGGGNSVIIDEFFDGSGGFDVFVNGALLEIVQNDIGAIPGFAVDLVLETPEALTSDALTALSVPLIDGLVGSSEIAGFVFGLDDPAAGLGFDVSSDGSVSDGGVFTSDNRAHSIVGGSGFDGVDYNGSAEAVQVDLGRGSGSGGDAAGDGFVSIEAVRGSAFADRLTGNDVGNLLDGGDGGDGDDTASGGDGEDTLTGGAGRDRLLAGAGRDTVLAEDGDDLVFGGDDADLISGGAGADRISGDAGDDILDGGEGADRVNGGSGHDTASGGADADFIFGLGGRDSLSGDGGNDTVFAGDGEDTILGGEGDDRVLAGRDNDLATGGAGNDVLRGAGGDDTLDGEAGNDILLGQAGNDSLIGGADNDTLSGGANDDDLNGGAGLDLLRGETGNDLLNGGDDRDRMFGGAGFDTLNGDGGNDVLRGDEGNDSITGGLGDDLALGGAGNDTLTGGADNDRLFGEGNRDSLDGGEGDDILNGGQSADTMTGGLGADWFEFDVGDGNDRITDFDEVNDTLAFIGQDIDDLTLRANGGNALVLFDGGSVTLEGVNIALLDTDEFVFG